METYSPEKGQESRGGSERGAFQADSKSGLKSENLVLCPLDWTSQYLRGYKGVGEESTA